MLLGAIQVEKSCIHMCLVYSDVTFIHECLCIEIILDLNRDEVQAAFASIRYIGVRKLLTPIENLFL